ncbi:Leucine rich repeat protein [Spraguea lophii 42_110]|uniref:Leucine rich repeat protein n=1 Tax=Spraguea lophii (strain 42_110) TaxID=1358809 RepID=S7W978_SPRLO|nr:Leucine rich repeat protein [Spraguea lophii 42_110]
MFLFFTVLLCTRITRSLVGLLDSLSDNTNEYKIYQNCYIEELNSDDIDININLRELSLELNLFKGSKKIPRLICECIKLKVFKSTNGFLDNLPDTFTKLINLEHLILNKNEFTEIPITVFSLINLQKLEMQDNHIKSIHNNIKYLKQLKILKLTKNLITYLPSGFCELKQLINLNLSNNKIMFNLKVFSVSEDKHIDFFDIMSSLNLNVLYLEHTKLECIPDRFEFKNIVEFYANRNKLSDIPVSTLRNSSLKSIYLDNNHFKKFPYNILTLEHLELFSIESNYIYTTIKITDLVSPNLKFLNLNNNKIKNFYISSDAVPCLTTLSLNNNHIENFIINFTSNSSLEKIYLRKNNISVLDKKFTNFKSLNLLDLRENNICKISDLNVISHEKMVLKIQLDTINLAENLFSTLSAEKVSITCKRKPASENDLNLLKQNNDENKLKILKLKFCYLSKIPKGIKRLSSVECLSFKNNKIKKVYNDFKDIKFLKKLDLSYNQIKFLDPNILLLESLESLNLANNCLKTFPPSIKQINHKKLKVNWDKCGDFLRGDKKDLGWMDIPFTYAPEIKVTFKKVNLEHITAAEVYMTYFNDMIQWDIEKIPQIILTEPENTEISNNDLINLWNLYLKPHITTESLINSMEKYVNALCKIETLRYSFINFFNSKQYNKIKLYLYTIFNTIKDKNDPKQIENICTAISQEVDFCYDAQYEMLQYIYISLKHDGVMDISYFIENLISKIKYDILSRIITSNDHSQNVHKLGYWRNKLADELGFIKNMISYGYLRSEKLIDKKMYILYQFFLLFKVESVAQEIVDTINENGNLLCIASQFIYENEQKESKLKEYMEFDDIELLNIEKITKEGIIFILKKMKLVYKNKTKRLRNL